MIQRLITAASLALTITVSLLAADQPRFRPASDVEPAIGRYLVALAGDSSGKSGDATADDLARTYSGRLEPFAADGFRGVMMVLRPTQARALSQDARVLWVQEQASGREPSIPSPQAAATPSPAAPPASRTPRSEWETSATLWTSGIYAYDGSGNITAIGNDTYRYDPLNRLKTATARTRLPVIPELHPENLQEFDYDDYGNLTTVVTKTVTPNGPKTEVAGLAVRTATNQLDEICPSNVDACYRGSYDPKGSGNQIGNDIGTSYIWDAVGMMSEVDASLRHERFVYDANDERIMTITYQGANEARRSYSLRGSDNKVAREMTFLPASNTWSLTRDYAYRGGVLIASFSTTAVEPDRHYHLDHLGSTRLVTNASGHRLTVHTYWPYGQEAYGSESDGERMKFTGHERDGEGSGSRLDYMHARYYEGVWGRFLSADPLLGVPEVPQSWNRYAYASNNPLTFTDPAGLCIQDPNDSKPCTDMEITVNGKAEEYTVLDTAADFIDGVGFSIFSMSGGADVMLGLRDDNLGQIAKGYGKQLMWAGPSAVGAAMKPAAAAAEGLSVASGAGGEVAPMTILRTLPPGTANGLVNEAKALTFTNQVEHAVVRLANGERALVSGGEGGISFAEGQVSRIIFHTHPYGAGSVGPSAADFAAIRALGQLRSYVIDNGIIYMFRP